MAAFGGLGAIASGIALRRDRPEERAADGVAALSWLCLVMGAFGMLWAVLLWTGLASGVK